MNIYELGEIENNEKETKDIETTQINSEDLNSEEINWSKVIGYILLMPPIISVLLFFYQFLVKRDSDSPLENFTNDNGVWIGSGDGHTSTLPLYFGLMAIAGSYLIKNSSLPKCPKQ